MTAAKQLKAWSYSRWKQWVLCPFKVKLTAIAGMKEPKGPALVRGQDVHADAEKYLTTKGGRVPSSLSEMADDFRALKKLKPSCELRFAFTKGWSPTDFFARDTYSRMVVDALVIDAACNTARIIDFKTGKVNEENQEQVELYALVVFLMYPDVTDVTVELWYVDHGIKLTYAKISTEKSDLLKKWDKRVKPMMNDKRFPAKPNFTCRWCHFRADNGGPCKH